MPKTDVQVTHAAWQKDDEDASGDPSSITRRIVGAVNSHIENALTGRELAIRFANDADVCALNSQFRGKNTATNVLSFPAVSMAEQEDAPLGDIILAYETVAQEAATQGKTLKNHTHHLVLHGVLHLLGYDHDTDESAATMEALETEILAALGIGNPYTENLSDAETAHVS